MGRLVESQTWKLSRGHHMSNWIPSGNTATQTGNMQEDVVAPLSGFYFVHRS